MSVNIRIKSNIDQVPVFLNKVNEVAVRRAVARSISRTLTGVNSLTAKEIATRKLIDKSRISVSQLAKRKYLTKDLSIKNGTPLSAMYGAFSIMNWHLSLAYFFPVQFTVIKARRGYAAVRVSPYGKSYTAGKGFMMTKKLGFAKSPIFQRDPKEAITKGGKQRLVKMYGPTLAGLIERNGVAPTLETYAIARYEKEFDTNMDYFLSRI